MTELMIATLDQDLTRWEVPADLRDWVDERTLVALCLAAAQELALPAPRPVSTRAGEPPAPAMVTLLAYCFATGICGSEEVEWAARHDRTARYLCAHRLPDAVAVRRFRRANRSWLERCLAEVCVRAWHLKHTPSAKAGAAASAGASMHAAIQEAVRQKFSLAMLLDTAAAE